MPTLQELLSSAEAVTIGQLRESVRQLTPEVFLGSSPHPALLEFESPPPEPDLAQEVEAGKREQAQARRMSLIQAAADLSQRRLYFLRPAPGQRKVVLGRSAKHADVALPDGTISKRHLRLTPGERRLWTALDLESQNGTWVEGSRLAAGVQLPLTPGHALRVSGFEGVFLSPLQTWTLIGHDAGAGSQLVLPPEGLPIKELVRFLKGMTEEMFLETCPHPFLLQVPTEVAPAEEWDEEHDSTLPLSRTRIISLQRRSSKISGALVHYLDPRDGPLALGRSGEHAQLVVPEGSVSKRHSEFRRTGERWMVVDLGSHNGTWIEGQRLEAGLASALSNGQAISFSSYRCLFLEPSRVWELVNSVAGRS